MNALEVVNELRAQGVELQAAGNRLRYRPVEQVAPALLDELHEHKDEILELLGDRVVDSLDGVEASSVTAADVCQMRLGEFASAGLVVEVRSKILDEVVIFASDNAPVDPGERRVVYRASELLVLAGLESSDLRQLHLAKRTFRGTVGPS